MEVVLERGAELDLNRKADEPATNRKRLLLGVAMGNNVAEYAIERRKMLAWWAD
jgi:hypothetical protein